MTMMMNLVSMEFDTPMLIGIEKQNNLTTVRVLGVLELLIILLKLPWKRYVFGSLESAETLNAFLTCDKHRCFPVYTLKENMQLF